MSRGATKRKKELAKVISTIPGFKLIRIEISKGDHLCCTVRDDAGHVFKAFTGCSCASDDRRARLNFRQDIKLQSNRLKGLVD